MAYFAARDGASGLHGALRGRSRPAGPACSADRRCQAFRRGGRARPRGRLAALLRRALRDPAAGRPKQAPRLPKDERALHSRRRRNPRRARAAARHAWTTTPPTRRLQVGTGYVENVTPEVWDYEVSGKQVLWHWFSYRRRDRSRPIIGDRRPPSPLDEIQPDHGCRNTRRTCSTSCTSSAGWSHWSRAGRPAGAHLRGAAAQPR